MPTSWVGLKVDGGRWGLRGRRGSGRVSVNLGAMELREDGMEAKLDIRFPISMNMAEIFSRSKRRLSPWASEADPPAPWSPIMWTKTRLSSNP